MERPPDLRPDEEERGEHNRLDFYNANEDESYNERGGTQGESPDAADERRMAHGTDDED